MFRPDCDTIVRLARDYNTIPVCREIYADLATPIVLLRRLARHSSRHYLLESVEGGEQWGRFSFLGFDPTMRVRCRDGVVTVEGAETRTVRTDRPLDVIREILSRYRAPRLPGMPPFTGGFVGSFAWSMFGYAEPRLSLGGDGDDFDLMLFDRVIAYDHLRQKICVVVNMKTDRVMEEYGRAVAEIERIIRVLCDTTPLTPQGPAASTHFACNVSQDEYCRVVERAKACIRDGDIFQAVVSRRFESPYQGSLLDPYRVLRTTNPSPCMVYMKVDDLEIMCSSPETLVRLQDGRLSTFPVAGSRPRGATVEEDRAQGLPQNERRFEQALRQPELAFICEVKRASPSKGLLAHDFPYQDIARDYEQAGAAAVSVLTEPEFFQSRDRHLEEIRAVVGVPLLRKDVVVSDYQIYESRLLGADAVLLICALLDTASLVRYLGVCEELGLSALVEAHSEDEVRSALAAGARIVGVNNRDLRTFEVDLDTCLRLRIMVPDDVVFVAESGIRTAEDVRRLREAGIHAALVGEALMTSSDKAAALALLRGDAAR